MNVIQRELATMQQSIEGMNNQELAAYQAAENEGQLEEKDQSDNLVDPNLFPPDEETPVEEQPQEVPKQEGDSAGKDKRIRELTKRVKQLNAEKQRIAEDAQLRLQEKERLLYERDHRSLQMEERSLNDYVTGAQREWQWAYDNGDSEKLAEAATKLSYYTAQLVNVKKDNQQFSQNGSYYPPSPRVPSYQEAGESSSSYADQVQDWIEQNSWYDQSSPDFNPELRSKLDRYANESLNNYLSPEDPRYIDYLNEFVAKNQQRLNEPSNNSRQLQMRKAPQMVAPVNKTPMSGGKVNPIDKILGSLTERQKEVALSFHYSDPKVNADPAAKLRKYAEGYLYDMQMRKREQEARAASNYYG